MAANFLFHRAQNLYFGVDEKLAADWRKQYSDAKPAWKRTHDVRT